MREWNDVIKRQHDRAAELLCCNFDKILDFTWHRVQPSCHSERHSGQLISCKRRMVRGLWTFLFHLPQLHSAKIRFKWFIIWRGGWEDEGVEGWSRSSRRQLCTSLCGLNNTERRDSAKQKRNRKRPLESSFQQPHVSRPPPSLRWVFLALLLSKWKANPANEVPRWVISSLEHLILN